MILKVIKILKSFIRSDIYRNDPEDEAIRDLMNIFLITINLCQIN